MRVCIWVVAIALILVLMVLALIHHGRNAVLAYERDHGGTLEGVTCHCDGFAWRRVDVLGTTYCEFSFTVAWSRGHGTFVATTSYAWSPCSGISYLASHSSAR